MWGEPFDPGLSKDELLNIAMRMDLSAVHREKIQWSTDDWRGLLPRYIINLFFCDGIRKVNGKTVGFVFIKMPNYDINAVLKEEEELICRQEFYEELGIEKMLILINPLWINNERVEQKLLTSSWTNVLLG